MPAVLCWSVVARSFLRRSGLAKYSSHSRTIHPLSHPGQANPLLSLLPSGPDLLHFAPSSESRQPQNLPCAGAEVAHSFHRPSPKETRKEQSTNHGQSTSCIRLVLRFRLLLTANLSSLLSESSLATPRARLHASCCHRHCRSFSFVCICPLCVSSFPRFSSRDPPPLHAPQQGTAFFLFRVSNRQNRRRRSFPTTSLPLSSPHPRSVVFLPRASTIVFVSLGPRLRLLPAPLSIVRNEVVCCTLPGLVGPSDGLAIRTAFLLVFSPHIDTTIGLLSPCPIKGPPSVLTTRPSRPPARFTNTEPLSSCLIFFLSCASFEQPVHRQRPCVFIAAPRIHIPRRSSDVASTP